MTPRRYGPLAYIPITRRPEVTCPGDATTRGVYIANWLKDTAPCLVEMRNPPLASLPYSVQTNDVPAYFEMKVSVPEFEAMLQSQFDTLYREGETIPHVM